MNDAQLITIAVSLGISFIAVLIGVMLNNSRLTDVKDVIKAEIKASEAQIATRASAAAVADLRILIERNHSEMIAKLSEMETRLTRLEGERRIV